MFLFADDLWHQEEPKRLPLKTDVEVWCAYCGRKDFVTGAMSVWMRCCSEDMIRWNDEPQDCPI